MRILESGEGVARATLFDDVADAADPNVHKCGDAVCLMVDAADGQAQRLNAAAQAMSGIVEMINNITGQINLLALNATIESARAGEDRKSVV